MTYPKPHSYLVENLRSIQILSAFDLDGWTVHSSGHLAISCYRYLYVRVMGKKLTAITPILL